MLHSTLPRYETLANLLKDAKVNKVILSEVAANTEL
jgi:hypothetical protein